MDDSSGFASDASGDGLAAFGEAGTPKGKKLKCALFVVAGFVIARIFWLAALFRRSETAPMPKLASFKEPYDPAKIVVAASLARLGNCASCRYVEERAPLSVGLPIDTLFGTIHSTNITPDRATGASDWLFAAYMRVIREAGMRGGVDREERHLYVSFPYEYPARITQSDIADLYERNFAQPAIAVQTPPNSLMFSANLCALLAECRLLFDSYPRFAAQPDKS